MIKKKARIYLNHAAAALQARACFHSKTNKELMPEAGLSGIIYPIKNKTQPLRLHHGVKSRL